MSARSAEERRQELVQLYHHLRDHHDCPLKATRTKLVFGAGNADAELMFVGEAPGAQEDLLGLPFVGRAGQLLDKLLGEIGLDRKDVFVANTIKCRPPGNRDPQPDEILECKPHLMRQIQLIEPKVICTLGNFATKLLTGSPQGITRVHGRPQRREVAGLDVTLYPLFHPAAALRTPSVLELLRADIQRLPELIAQQPGAEPLSGPGAGAAAAEAEQQSAAPPRAPAADQLGLFG